MGHEQGNRYASRVIIGERAGESGVAADRPFDAAVNLRSSGLVGVVRYFNKSLRIVEADFLTLVKTAQRMRQVQPSIRADTLVSLCATMTSDSRDFEEIAASIKRALEPREEVKVVPHARVRDAVTKRMRDFDVLIEAIVAGTPFRIGVECRRKKRPVDKPQIEAFVTKLRDCRVDKGVFVSSSGFADEALTAAEYHGIVCCHLTKVDVLPWIQLLSIAGQFRTNVKFHGDVQMVAVGSRVEEIPSMIEFPDGSRSPMPFSEIGTYILDLEKVAAGHASPADCLRAFYSPDRHHAGWRAASDRAHRARRRI